MILPSHERTRSAQVLGTWMSGEEAVEYEFVREDDLRGWVGGKSPGACWPASGW